MKIAVFGGTGSLGSNFVRYALERGDVEPVVYSTAGAGAGNRPAHSVEVRAYPANDPETIVFDDDTEAVVNFAHPWERRGGIDGGEQIERFAKLVAAARRRQPSLRLVHVSSMSVFEPFRSAHPFSETDPLDPPAGDVYAREKVLAETALRALPDADRWQLHLRPTVVYGPYCAAWTDRLLAAFRRGNVDYWDLSGSIQPVYGEDLSRFVHERLHDFTPGIYNFPGPEKVSWQAFVDTFREIVGVGELVRVPAGARDETPNAPGIVERAVTKAARTLRPAAAAAAAGRRTNATLLTRSFFAVDRLLSDAALRRDFPTFRRAAPSEVKAELAAYYRDRFAGDVEQR